MNKLMSKGKLQRGWAGGRLGSDLVAYAVLCWLLELLGIVLPLDSSTQKGLG